MDGQVVNFSDDFYRESQKISLLLQADQAEEELIIMKEINEEESRLPAKIYVFDNIFQHPKIRANEFEDNPLPF